MDKNAAKQLLFNRGVYYKGVTRRIRWLAILLVLVTYPLNSEYSLVIIGLIISAVIYNALWYWEWLTKTRVFGSYISMNMIDNGFALLLVMLSGGINSPYYVLFILMAVTATYWYGYKGLSILGVFHIIVALGMIQYVNTEVVPKDLLHSSGIFLFTVIIVGILTERLTHADRQERQTAVAANRQIETERQRLLALLNSIGDSVVALDRNGKTILYNGALLELINSNIQLTDQSITNYLRLLDEHKKPISFRDLVKADTGIIRRRDLAYKSPDGSLISLDITISPITAVGDSKEMEGGFIMIMKDITREKTLEETRDEFIAVTSHELRTPIAIAEANLSVALFSEKKSLTPRLKEFLTKAHDNVVFLGALVEDLSTLARAERGILDVDLKMVEPAELTQRLKDNFDKNAQVKGLEITTTVGPGIHPILTSPSHIYEVLQNFMTNAVKYSETGKIEVRADTSTTNKGSIIFSVKDTGIGISASDKKKIFDKFFRSEDYRTRTTGGTGLGLYIAKKLADRLSGKIWFDSELNKGTTFYLEVPPASQRAEDKGKVADAQVDDFVSTI